MYHHMYMYAYVRVTFSTHDHDHHAFYRKGTGLNIYFLLQKDETQHDFPSISIGSYKSKNAEGEAGGGLWYQ